MTMAGKRFAFYENSKGLPGWGSQMPYKSVSVYEDYRLGNSSDLADARGQRLGRGKGRRVGIDPPKECAPKGLEWVTVGWAKPYP